jgi:alkaline phosphatase
MTEKSYIGFTTKGHTGEDVFLAIYDAENNNPRGVVRSEEINKYLCKSLGFIDKDGNTTLKDSTAKYFSKHDDVFKNCNITMLKNDSIYLWNDYVKTFNSISKSKGNELMYSKSKNKNYVEKNKDIVLIVKKGKNVLEIPAYENNYYLNGKQGKLESVVIYVDKNETFYLPKQLLRVLEN